MPTGFENVDAVHALLGDAIRADQDAARAAAEVSAVQARRGENAGLTLGEIDDHLDALRKLEADVLGHEFESLAQIADAVETVRDDLETLL